MRIAIFISLIFAFCFSFSYAFDPLDNYDDESYYAHIFNLDSTSFHSYYFQPSLFTSHSTSLSLSISPVLSGRDLFFRHDGKLIINFSDNFQYHMNYRVADSPTILDGYKGIRREAVGNIRGDVVSSGITFKIEHLLFAINKARIQTSHFGDNLLVNRYHTPTENIIFCLNNEEFLMESILMVLQPVNSKSKSLVYHRYSYTGARAKIGFSEVSVLSYENISSVNYKYFMPYSFLYEVEENYDGGSNIFWRFDLSYLWGRNYAWMELLVDDYALDNKSPPKTAFLMGVKSQIFGLPYLFSITKVNRWVYNYGFDEPEYRFVDNGVSLGHPIGPDALQISISSNIKLSKDIYNANIFPKVNFIANGEGSLFEDTPVAARENFGYSDQDFLTGNVTYTVQYRLLGIFHSGNKKLMIAYDNHFGKSKIVTTFEYHFSMSKKN
jgi:hypothetical protein